MTLKQETSSFVLLDYSLKMMTLSPSCCFKSTPVGSVFAIFIGAEPGQVEAERLVAYMELP